MSREFLEEVLEKFAQVTSILVETSKIKDDLERKKSHDTDFKDILKRTQRQVESLYEHATSVRNFFKKQPNDRDKRNGRGSDNENGTESSSDADLSNENEDKNVQKPLIKLVDINKLVEPRNLLKKQATATRVVANNTTIDTVVILSSDEEETTKSTKSRAAKSPKVLSPRPASKRKTALETIKKTRLHLQSSESESNDEVLSNVAAKKKEKKKTSKRRNLDKLTLSDTSVSSGSSDEATNTARRDRSKSKKEESTKDKEDEESAQDELPPDWKKDPKFNSECYIKVLRVPCEKLKEYYLEKLELRQVSKLCDVSSLKRKRRKSVSVSSSEGDSRVKNKPKKKVTEKSNEKQSDSDTTKSDLEADQAPETNAAEKNTTDLQEEMFSDGGNQNDAERIAEDALNLLNSDKESDDGHSGKSDQEPEKEKNEDTAKEADEEGGKNEETNNSAEKENVGEESETPPEEVSTETDVQDAQNEVEGEKSKEDEKEDESEKSSKDNEKEDEGGSSGKENEKEDEGGSSGKENEKEDEGDKEAEKKDEESSKNDKKEDEAEEEGEKSNKEKSDDSDKNEAEKNERKDSSKKKWRKDKLLTAKISSSESEDELEKFKRKKENMQKDVLSSDDEPLPRNKKKRLMKKRKKKAIVSDSDSDKKDSADDFQSESSSSSESDKGKNKKKEEEEEKPKRKRVKRVRDSSDEDDENKSTRKQIRHIWGKDSLAETTKKAEAEEKERKARISEKQKKYNQIYESSSLKNAKVEKVVLDFDEENKKELLRVDDDLVSKLKPHQASGIQFMWDACFESLERAKSDKGSGCILAHCMGLGKTLQVIALSHTLLINSEETKVRKILVVSPLNTVLNWVNEFKQWLPDLEDFEVFELVSFKQNYERQYQMKLWHNNGGVLVIGYDMFRNLSNPDNKRLSKKMRHLFQEALVDPGPDLVICDEGHLLKNEKTNISIAMNRIRTLRRIVLTGTPLQNNLKEYFCMVQFIKPNLLGTYKEYLNRFVNPIINGQYTDSTPHDIQIMRKRSHVLHKMLDGIVQRRDYSVLEPYLPPKHEYVLFLKLTETQIKLYQHYMDHFARRSTDGSNRTSFLFVDFQALQRICTHPRVLRDKSIEMKLAKDKLDDSEEESEGSLKDFIDDDDAENSTSASSNSSSNEDGQRKQPVSRKRVTRAAAAAAKENGEEDDDVVEITEEKEWWQTYCDGDELDNIAHSSKLFLLFEILKECEQIGDKVLVFSQSLYSLNVIEYFIGKIHDATQEGETLAGYSGSWCLGLDYFRLDGSSSCDSRNIWCKTFNDPSNTRARLFLISTRAGGLGINLVAANRVIIFDVSWNPSHDIQSIYRVYRFGQTKPCYVYRFVTLGTMEMKIYERQVTKQAISKRVIDEQQIDRHYNQNDLAELYRFEPNPGERPIPLVPKDVLLGELIQKCEDRIYKYHEHQTLLENKEDEVLNEEERKAAWEEFENEKKQRTVLGNYSYARPNNIELALTNIVRSENPTWTDIQIRAMIPSLHTQLQQQVSNGDLRMYKRVQQELNVIQAYQNQRLKEQFYQQQLAAAMKYHNSSMLGQILGSNMNQMPGTSHQATPTNNLHNAVIELND